MGSSPGGSRRRVVQRWNEVLYALSAEPRRRVIISLMDGERGEAIELPEGAMSPNAEDDPEDLLTVLYHQHLPKLAEMGFIRWDDERKVVTRGPRFEQAAAVLRALEADASELPDELVHGCRRLEVRQ